MKRATVRDLQYRFGEMEVLLRDGEEIQITRRNHVVGRPLPPKRQKRAKKRVPDLGKMRREIFGSKVFKVNGAELIAEERGGY